VGLEERAVAAEEGGDGLHPLARLLRRLARARPDVGARRRRRHRERRGGKKDWRAKQKHNDSVYREKKN
jgi:hypothetical protein